MDEIALPILLAGLIRHKGKALHYDPEPIVDDVHTAAARLVQNGPSTAQDRWEEDGGYTPFTLAAEIAALLAAADLAEASGATVAAAHLRETADSWNACIERWLYVTDTELARRVGVDGYYLADRRSRKRGGGVAPQEVK